MPPRKGFIRPAREFCTMPLKYKLKPALGILVILGAVLAVFAPGLFFKQALFLEDITYIYYPTKTFFYQMGQAGKIFFWNPYLFSGSSNLGSGYFYPLNFLFFLLPPERALLYSCFLHVFLGAVFLFCYLRNLELGIFESAVASLLFALSGFMLTETRHVEILAVSALLPLLFLCWDKRKDHPVYLSLGALTLGLQILAGNPQMAYISCLALGLKILWDFWGKENNKTEVIFSGLGIIVPGLLLSGVQLFTNQPLMQLTARKFLAGSGFSNSESWPGSQILPFFCPDLLPHIAKDGVVNSYFAFLGVILALAGLIKGGGKKWFWAFLAVFAFLTALGERGGLNTLLVWIIPVHKLTRAPLRFLSLGTLAASVLAAYGLHYLKKLNFNLGVFIGLLALGELLLLSRSGLPFKPSAFNQTPQVVAGIMRSEDKSPYPPRVLLTDPENYNKSILWKFSNVSGYSPLVPHYYMEYLWFLQHGRFPTPADYRLILRYSCCIVSNVFNHQMELLNLKYVFFNAPGGNYEAIALKESGKRFFLVGEYRVIREPAKLLAGLQEKNFKPFDCALFQTPIDFPNHQKVQGGVKLLSYTPDRIELEVQNRYPNILVLSEIDFPGWRAAVDGKKTAIHRADYILRSIGLPPGTHRVVFSYHPTGLLAGFLVSLFALLLLLGDYFRRQKGYEKTGLNLLPKAKNPV